MFILTLLIEFSSPHFKKGGILMGSVPPYYAFSTIFVNVLEFSLIKWKGWGNVIGSKSISYANPKYALKAPTPFAIAQKLHDPAKYVLK